jgi:hypothetical protein
MSTLVSVSITRMCRIGFTGRGLRRLGRLLSGARTVQARTATGR